MRNASDCQVTFYSTEPKHSAAAVAHWHIEDLLTVQMCCAILIKLVLDTWIRTGAAMAFPMALVVLSRAANSVDVAARVRAYDLLLNLSAHAELLRGLDYKDQLSLQQLPQSPAAPEADASDGPADRHAVGGADEAVQNDAELRHWLHHLLLRLLQITVEVSAISAMPALLQF